MGIVRRIPRLRTDCLLLLVLTLLGGTAGAAAKAPPRQVLDLHYGEVLFYFYQGDYFDAITRALSAQQQRQVPHHQQDTALLTGGMELSYGMDRAAQQVFDDLLDAKVAEPMRNRAWFYLAKLNYQRDNLAQAQQVLTRIKGDLPESLAPQQQLLRAQVLMAQGQYDQAAALLDGWKGPADWQAYARFNLGVALLRSGKTAQGERQLDAVGQLAGDSEELLALRDKANLALGYVLLQNKDAARARHYLERIRLQGPFSNQALLAFGWAASAQGKQEQALIPWQELSRRDVIDSAVQEGLLAVPYAYAQLQAYPSAATHYQQAISAFEKEMQSLDTAIAAIRDGKLVETMLGTTQDNTDMGWSWRAAPPPQAAETQYLWQLLAGHEFQTALKNYRDLLFLQNNLAHWSTSIDAYQDMLDTREARYRKQLPQARDRMQSLDLKALIAQRDALATRLTESEHQQDVMALASTRELDWQARMTGIQQRLDRVGNSMPTTTRGSGRRVSRCADSMPPWPNCRGAGRRCKRRSSRRRAASMVTGSASRPCVRVSRHYSRALLRRVTHRRSSCRHWRSRHWKDIRNTWRITVCRHNWRWRNSMTAPAPRRERRHETPRECMRLSDAALGGLLGAGL
jgi:Tetratricopeptide repeat